jgi:hypothetical protein
VQAISDIRRQLRYRGPDVTLILHTSRNLFSPPGVGLPFRYPRQLPSAGTSGAIGPGSPAGRGHHGVVASLVSCPQASQPPAFRPRHYVISRPFHSRCTSPTNAHSATAAEDRTHQDPPFETLSRPQPSFEIRPIDILSFLRWFGSPEEIWGWLAQISRRSAKDPFRQQCSPSCSARQDQRTGLHGFGVKSSIVEPAANGRARSIDRVPEATAERLSAARAEART